jgi:hypothetical protein
VHETEIDRSEGKTGNLRVGCNLSGSLVGKQEDFGLEGKNRNLILGKIEGFFSSPQREDQIHINGLRDFLSYGKAGGM